MVNIAKIVGSWYEHPSKITVKRIPPVDSPNIILADGIDGPTHIYRDGNIEVVIRWQMR